MTIAISMERFISSFLVHHISMLPFSVRLFIHFLLVSILCHFPQDFSYFALFVHRYRLSSINQPSFPLYVSLHHILPYLGQLGDGQVI